MRIDWLVCLLKESIEFTASSKSSLDKMPESVTSMADVEVDIGIREIEVSAQGRRLVKLPLAKDISEDDARAKFSKKARELRITAPMVLDD